MIFRIIDPNYRFYSKQIFKTFQSHPAHAALVSITRTSAQLVILGHYANTWLKGLKLLEILFRCVMSLTFKKILECLICFMVSLNLLKYIQRNHQKCFSFTINYFAWTQFTETVFRNNFLVSKVNYIFL